MVVVSPTANDERNTAITDLPDTMVLSAKTAAALLGRIAETDHPKRQTVFWGITRLWLGPTRTHVTYRPSDDERDILKLVGLPDGVVTTHRYVAVYRDPETGAHMVVRTNERPRKYKTLKTRGGARRFRRLTYTDQHKERIMAAKAKASKGKKSSKDEDLEDDLLDELEGLEELDDEDEEEPDEEEEDEDEDDEEEEEDEDEEDDYASMSASDLKLLCKERGVKGIAKANKTKLIELLEAADEEGDEEDEEDEEEEDDTPDFDEMNRAELKAYLKDQDSSFKAKTSQSDDDLRALARGDEDEDEEEDDPPAKTKAKPVGTSKTKGKSSGKRGAPTGPRALPGGRLSAGDVAEMAGVTALSVRTYLRSPEGQEKFPKDADLNRYSFTKRQAESLAKVIKSRPQRGRPPGSKTKTSSKGSTKTSSGKKRSTKK